MSRNLVILVSLASVCTLSSTGALQAQHDNTGPPAVSNIPGINAEDPFPNACVSCHRNYVDMNLDTRLSSLMRHWYEEVEPGLLAKAQAAMRVDSPLIGAHPDAEDALGDIPAACLSCHDRESEDAPPFARMLHAIHLVGGEANHYMTLFQGECTYCHKLDLGTGAWRIPSGPEE